MVEFDECNLSLLSVCMRGLPILGLPKKSCHREACAPMPPARSHAFHLAARDDHACCCPTLSCLHVPSCAAPSWQSRQVPCWKRCRRHHGPSPSSTCPSYSALPTGMKPAAASTNAAWDVATLAGRQGVAPRLHRRLHRRRPSRKRACRRCEDIGRHGARSRTRTRIELAVLV